MSKNRRPNQRRWINTRVVLVWNGSCYVEQSVEGYWYSGPVALAHNNPSTDQEIYRWRDDDGTNETDGTWLEVANTTHDFDLSSGNVDARLRFSVAENGGADEVSKTYPIEFNINNTGWNTLGAATTGCIYFDSTKLTNGNNTTEQLSGPGTFQSSNGGQCEDGTVDAFVLGANADVEFEYTIRFVAADLNDGDSIDFRVALLDAYTVTANATISKLTNYTMPANSGSYSVTGTDANPEYHRLFNAESGSYSVTGTDVAFAFGYSMLADSGSYSVSGTDAGSLRTYNLAAENGAYSVVGSDATLFYKTITELSLLGIGGRKHATFQAKTAAANNYTITADSGSYSVSGTDAALEKNYLIAAESGGYTVTGTDAALTKQYNLAAETGSYTVNGTDAALLRNTVIPADSGSYTINGTDANLIYGNAYTLTAESGSYSVQGTDATLLANYTLVAESGNYAIVGSNANLTYDGTGPSVEQAVRHAGLVVEYEYEDKQDPLEQQLLAEDDIILDIITTFVLNQHEQI